MQRSLIIFTLCLTACGQTLGTCDATCAAKFPLGSVDPRTSYRAAIEAGAAIIGPFSAATNHADDILGTLDDRHATWGATGYNVHKIEFHPPAGYRTRILRVYGDFQGWLRKNPSGNCVGVLWGLQTTAPEGSKRVTPAADNTLIYRQQAICERAPFYLDFDADVSVAGLLEKDNVLYSKSAVFMNETGEPVHSEPSFIIVFQFEKEQ